MGRRPNQGPTREGVGKVSLPADAVLLVIDVQEGFDDPRWGRRNNPGAEGNIARLLQAWRRTGRPVVFVRHDSREPGSPLAPGSPGNRIKPEVAPLDGETVLAKHAHGPFVGTDLEQRLRAAGWRTVVVTGLTTDHCCSTTARMAADMGFETYVVSDATATFDRRGPDGRVFEADLVHAAELAALHGEFARVVTTRELLQELGEE